jgi:hypothetical protein
MVANAFSNLQATIDRTYLTLPDFLALVSVMINETGGNFEPIAEGVGRPGHAGIAYAFDSIAGVKASYNAAPSQTALQCFNDADFLDAHGAKVLAAAVRNTADPRWAGTVYPTPDFPTSTNPATTGIILEADFYKFRGRGVIQTTWRSGYVAMIGFVQSYTGTHPTITAYRDAWAGQAAQTVASRSSNDDWDALYLHTDFEIAREAVRIHNAGGGHYFWLSEDRTVIDGAVGVKGSVRRAGRTVSGSSAYGDTLHDRVFQMLTTLGL